MKRVALSEIYADMPTKRRSGWRNTHSIVGVKNETFYMQVEFEGSHLLAPRYFKWTAPLSSAVLFIQKTLKRVPSKRDPSDLHHRITMAVLSLMDKEHFLDDFYMMPPSLATAVFRECVNKGIEEYYVDDKEKMDVVKKLYQSLSLSSCLLGSVCEIKSTKERDSHTFYRCVIRSDTQQGIYDDYASQSIDSDSDSTTTSSSEESSADDTIMKLSNDLEENINTLDDSLRSVMKTVSTLRGMIVASNKQRK